MFDPPVLEIHRHRQWIPAATLEEAAEGWVRVDYLPDYIFSPDPVAVALDLPVAFAPPATGVEDLETPSFLSGLVPPGRGRRALLHLLGRGAGETAEVLWPLLASGAFGAVGNLRVDTAAAFYEGYVGRTPPPPGAVGGLGLEELVHRGKGTTLEDLPPHATLAEAVRWMRHLSGLTQVEFARHRGISVQALRQVESGTANPTVATLDAIAAVFGLRTGFVPLVRGPPGGVRRRAGG